MKMREREKKRKNDALRLGKKKSDDIRKDAKEEIMHPIRAAVFSLEGLYSAIIHERAFRHELLFGVIHLSAVFYFDLTVPMRMVLILSFIVLLCSEMLNSAIEAIVDKTSPEWHLLAKRAKDYGSAASFISIIGIAILWLCVIVG